jgi:tRNA(Ser,Leu) C12 N-acetylase TAN1
MLGKISAVPDETSTVADWNVIVTLSEPTFRIARSLLSRWGHLRRTEHHNVAVMMVRDVAAFLREFAAAVEETPGILNAMSHVVPFEQVFAFGNAAEFEQKSREIALSYISRLADKSFHVRLRRRGLKGIISTPEEERFLDDVLLDALAAAGHAGRIRFDDPDYVLLIETVGGKAGIALWSHDDLKRCPFIGAY